MTKSTDTEDNTKSDTKDDGSLVDLVKLILFVGVGYFGYTFFTTDHREEKFMEHVADQALADQRAFLDIIGRSVAAADDAANDAAKVTAYIKGNRELCGGTAYNPLDGKVGWVGIFDEANVTDSNDKMYVEVEIGFDNKIRSEVPREFRDTVLGLKAGQAVSLSGNFRSGNMNENQCLQATWSRLTGSTPELTRRSFSFDLQHIAPILE